MIIVVKNRKEVDNMKKVFEIEELKDMNTVGDEVKDVIAMLIQVGRHYAVGCSGFSTIKLKGDGFLKFSHIDSIEIGWGVPEITTDFSWIKFTKEKGIKLTTYGQAYGDGTSKEWDTIEQAYMDMAKSKCNWLSVISMGYISYL